MYRVVIKATESGVVVSMEHSNDVGVPNWKQVGADQPLMSEAAERMLNRHDSKWILRSNHEEDNGGTVTFG